MALSQDFLYQLRLNNDIVDVMASYVNMKKAGRDFVCLCPFHNEKTPSCHIYSDTQSFYCFGCGAGGDVITFIRMAENLDYIESVKYLAERVGMALPEDGNDENLRIRTRLLEMNRKAGEYFHKLLFSEKGQAGLDYFLNRGLSVKTIKRFGLGYADDDWHGLHNYMRGLGYNEDELVQGSLLSRGNNRVFDKFVHRAMFPIFDIRGNVIGFGGRALDTDSHAKYLNSSETLVFKKKNNLFNLNYAKNSNQKTFILCEGYMDVISVYQAGFKGSIATLGTAITSEQARLIRQYAEDVVIAYDSDGAGQKATMKAINLFSENGVSARVLKMDDAKDPDEFIKKYGADAFEMLIDKAGSAIEFEINKLKTGLDMESTEGKTSFLKKAVYLLADISNPIERAVHISNISKLTEISSANIEQGVVNIIKGRRKKSFNEQKRKLINGDFSRDKINPEATQLPAQARAEKGIISCLVNNPSWLEKVLLKLDVDDFPTSFHRKLFEQVKNIIKSGGNPDLSELGKEFSTDEMGKITEIINEYKRFSYDEKMFLDCVDVLVKYKEKSNIKQKEEMSAEELMEFANRLREIKK